MKKGDDETAEEILEKIAKPSGKTQEKGYYIRWLSELGKKDVDIAGGKGANLAEMFNAKLPVPPAFIITSYAYDEFVVRIKPEIDEILSDLNVDNTEELESKAKKIREIILKNEMSEEISDEISEAYENLSVDEDVLKAASDSALSIIKAGREHPFVAVRSSATTEDLETASFAGQQETFLNIKGTENLLKSVKECWASLFTARAIYYRKKKKFDKASIAVVVQKMISADKSGVIFTINPLNNEDEIVVEAVFGLGEGIVSGAIKPDNYILSKELKLLQKHIAVKDIFFTRDSSGKTVQKSLSEEQGRAEVLNSSELKRLGRESLAIHELYQKPQDIEFAIEGEKVYIVQARPVTTKAEVSRMSVKAELILNGIAASPGRGSGKVKIIKKIEDLSGIGKGDVLVTKMTNPDMVVTMQRCSAIVTDEGGLTAHAAIVSREMGIPAVVGTKNATKVLKEGQVVTVSGSEGKVYEGTVSIEEKQEAAEIKPKVVCRTKIKVIIDLPIAAERASKAEADGIGLMRLEGIIAESGQHPMMFVNEGREEEYTNILFNGIMKISKFFSDKPIWIRLSDIRSDEYANLKGAPKIKEANPMLGLHGIRQGIKEKSLLRAELKAIKHAAESNDIGIIIPQVIRTEELQEVKKTADELGVKAKIGVMIETPASVEIINDLCKEGIDFISFGTNDLTQYVLAVDRGNEAIQDLYDEMHPAMMKMISYVISVCKRNNVETSICGQAGSRKDMIAFLIKQGIDSISVDAGKVHEASVIAAEVEKELESREQEKTEAKEEVNEEKQEAKEEKEQEQYKEAADEASYANGEEAKIEEPEEIEVSKEEQESEEQEQEEQPQEVDNTEKKQESHAEEVDIF